MDATRPRYHFSPPAGWINDPNGLVRVDGVYHLFYQANPHGLVHGPMHWGHASSRDLANWQHHPIALYPEESGQCFSGSAVNASDGMVTPQLAGRDDVLLFYTAHRNRPDGGYDEEQCVAVAGRAMDRFAKFPGNPVLANQGPADFRDPKVIWHAATARWIIVVTHGQSIGFYSSPDALNWRFESEFGRNEGRHGPGPWECPDLFPLTVAGSGQEVWVLVVGLGNGHVSGGSGTQYFLGDFDGRNFRNRNAPGTELFLDWGRDFYAAQSFSGLGDEDPLVLAWMSNWAYANHTPNTGFRGCMSLPRRLRLADKQGRLALTQRVDDQVAARFPALEVSPETKSVDPGTDTYQMRLTCPARAGLELCLFGEDTPVLEVKCSPAGNYRVRFLRASRPQIAAEKTFATNFEFEIESPAPLDLQVFVDRGLVELGLGSGENWISNIYFPQSPAGKVSVAYGTD